MTAHQLFTFIDTLTDSLIGIFCQNVEGLGITQHSDDAGNVAKAAPQHDKQTQVENRREPLLLEGAFRLACLVKADAMQSPAVMAIREAAAAQREDGSFPLTIEDSVYVLRAVWALYEAEAKKEDLTVLLRWFQWAAKQWDDIAADEYVRAFPADLLELLEKVYRITGIPVMNTYMREMRE